MHRTREELIETLTEAAGSINAALGEAQAASNSPDLYEVLGHVTRALDEVIEAEARTVDVWRSWGASWADVGEFYGTTRQAAQQRFGTHA